MADGKATSEEKRATELAVLHAQKDQLHAQNRDDTGLFTLEGPNSDTPVDTGPEEPINLKTGTKLTLSDPEFGFYTQDGDKTLCPSVSVELKLTDELDDRVLKAETIFWELDDAEDFQRELSRAIGGLLAHIKKEEEG